MTPASGSGETATVQFQIDGGNVGTPVKSQRQQRRLHSTSSLTAGNHWIVAIYSGDGNFSGNTSSTFNENIGQSTPAITWPTPAAITYGTALSGTQLDATASVPAILPTARYWGRYCTLGRRLFP